MKRSIYRLLPALICISLFSGCGGDEYDRTFYSGIHQESSTIKVNVQIPEGATNIYLTTDNTDPIANESCRIEEDTIVTVDRPMVIKLSYEHNGTPHLQTGIYVIADRVEENRFGNRDAIEIFETFITQHINPSFGPTPSSDQFRTISDGQGGTASRRTTVDGWFFLEGRQTFTFNNYQYLDKTHGTQFIAESGAIFGYMDGDGGYYNTDEQGETMVFSGTYTGTAEGHFYLNEYSQTTRGFYRVTCIDRWCADNEVYYALDSFREFVEIYPKPSEAPRSCN
ncbi:MAG: hypothetical protein MI867_03025 [Pseudomonadales bacterium]|nr:hypothetical protein [Pseudomonadales bacterium]